MHKKLLFAIIAAITTTNAYSDQIVTSQAYVDNADARKVDIAQGTGDNNANVGKTLVVNSSGNLELGTVSADNFVEDSITDGVTDRAPSENAVHDALENKQDTIATDMVTFTDPEELIDYEVPSLVAYDSTNGINGTRIGLVDSISGSGLSFLVADSDPWNSSYAVYDNYVPTFRTVATGLQTVYEHIPNILVWDSSLQTPINNYSTTFSSAANTWPNNQIGDVPTAQTLAYGLASKQNKLPANNATTNPNGSLVAYGTTAGNPTSKKIVTAVASGGTDIPTDGAVYAAVDTKQNKMTCTRWLDNAEHTDENCLLWDLAN